MHEDSPVKTLLDGNSNGKITNPTTEYNHAGTPFQAKTAYNEAGPFTLANDYLYNLLISTDSVPGTTQVIPTEHLQIAFRCPVLW
jgi:hypothetical protein